MQYILRIGFHRCPPVSPLVIGKISASKTGNLFAKPFYPFEALFTALSQFLVQPLELHCCTFPRQARSRRNCWPLL